MDAEIFRSGLLNFGCSLESLRRLKKPESPYHTSSDSDLNVMGVSATP